MAQTNAYLIGENDRCILIDAPLGVDEWLKREGATPSDLLLTHQHYDHVEGVAKLAEQGVQIHAYSPHSTDLTLELLLQQSGIQLSVAPYTVNHLLKGKSVLEVADWTFKLEHIPGHSLDSVAYITDDHAFSGDTLFSGGIGRADLPGGDMDLLVRGIREKLLTLDKNTRIFPGHGPTTTIAEEEATNIYL